MNDIVQELEKYGAFSLSLASWGVTDWKPYEITAEDGAITTVFHLTKNMKSFKMMPNGQSVLVMHGTFMDASTWFIPKEFGEAALGLTYEEGDKPLPLMLLDMGYDVWVGSMRGT